MAKAGLREVKLWSPRLAVESREDGTILVRQTEPLGPYPDRLNERLVHWAETAPDRVWMAERHASGAWREVTYRGALDAVRRLGQALIDRGLSVERPLLILSGNDTEHALMALAAQHVGVPSAAVSTAYSLVSTDYGKLRDIAGQLTPGLVFTADGEPFRPAIEAVFGPEVEVAVTRNPVPGRACVTFADLAATEATGAVDDAFAALGPDTIAKFLFTSGTTGSPKAVIQTQRLICSNQEMVADCYAFMREEPPVVVDWAPWNHTASGNKVFNLVLYNGGTYYIDSGKPSPRGMAETIRNLREVSPTWYFNVPIGYEMLVEAMERDTGLRERFFARLKMMMYAGAGMAQHTWDRLSSMAEETIGSRVLLATGLGSTETGPFALKCTQEQEKAGNIGIPARGVTLKLVPHEDKLEARVKGPAITPGYWRRPDLTAEAFDEEGFYKLGDALRFAVPGDAAAGFFFDGRLAENFKLATGTWVPVGDVRAKLVNALGGLARDAAIAGEDRDEVGAILIPFMPAVRGLVPEEASLDDEKVLCHPRVRERLQKLLAEHAAKSTGSATRVMRAIFMEEAPSLDKGEVTDKGSINQRALLRGHPDLVEALYSSDDPRIVHARRREVAA
ncbi:feruloyl-CoA synthase [Aurantimonas sp. VKM B-3413]|uniref:feruloyl-CoA synthase n=1 Tax=Aurantimonas sp. VKM B-3413 TaxID=2779401 RepID=UPI001E5417EA|nr:feruloyl-CoA synthase [Aurantimonas sp. VKM B-3413]MCB8840403.1 feruloyl-CoA synthase [Aurantimonas sp. VKM B-3413]